MASERYALYTCTYGMNDSVLSALRCNYCILGQIAKDVGPEALASVLSEHPGPTKKSPPNHATKAGFPDARNPGNPAF